MDGVAVKPLTVDFHEGGFQSKLNQENALGFWFQLSDKQRRQAGSPWGPADAQALNRYSYVQNNPLRWTDPTGHMGVTHGSFYTTYHLTHEEATWLMDFTNLMWAYVASNVLLAAKSVTDVMAQFKQWIVENAPGGLLGSLVLAWADEVLAITALGATASTVIGFVAALLGAVEFFGFTLAVADALYGKQGVDITIFPSAPTMPIITAPTVSRQQGEFWGFINPRSTDSLSKQTGSNCIERRKPSNVFSLGS
jgi:hypothetical protein